jgi:dynein heavy chain
MPADVIRMWIHENNRVFGDRLIDSTDRDWLVSLLNQEAEETFKLAKKDIYNSERLVFGDYMDGIESETRTYK